MQKPAVTVRSNQWTQSDVESNFPSWRPQRYFPSFRGVRALAPSKVKAWQCTRGSTSSQEEHRGPAMTLSQAPGSSGASPSAGWPPKSSEEVTPNLHAPPNPQHQRWRGQTPGGRDDNIVPNYIFLSSRKQPACAFKFSNTQKALQWFALAGLSTISLAFGIFLKSFI